MSDLTTARAVCGRDFLVISRHRPMLTALAAHVALLSAFVLAWSGAGPVPWVGGTNFYEQQRTVHLCASALVVPWAICRFMASERGERWGMMIRFSGLSAAWLFGAHLVALGAFAAIVAASGWPLLLVGQQMSAVPATTALLDAGRLMGFSIAATIAAMGFALVFQGAITGWLASTVAALLLAGLTAGPHPVSGGIALAAAIGFGIAITRHLAPLPSRAAPA
jgi:hypothetical protein